MNDLDIVMQVLGVDEGVALEVLELCSILDQEDAIAQHGYPKDTPQGRKLSFKLADPAYLARLRALASSEGITLG